MPLKAIALNCSLKHASGEPSSTDAMIRLIGTELGKHDVELSETIRIADHDILPGVTSDEGGGDAWPDVRRRILEHGGGNRPTHVVQRLEQVGRDPVRTVLVSNDRRYGRLASNAAHVTKLLKQAEYPGIEGSK